MNIPGETDVQKKYVFLRTQEVPGEVQWHGWEST